MPGSVPQRRASDRVPSLDVRMASMDLGGRPPSLAVQPAAPRELPGIVPLVLETFRELGWDDTEACARMRFDGSHFSRVKQARARLAIEALWELPDEFWLDFLDRLQRARGLSPARRREIQIQRIAELLKLLLEAA
jgi:hypothetical protein